MKRSPSMLPRFKGRNKKKHLVDALCVQPAVAGIAAIAERLEKTGKLIELKANKLLIQQGNSDNQIYFIVSGSVRICINGRQVAIRSAGQHVGEMAMIDRTARRSASVIAIEPTIVLEVTEPHFSMIAKTFPELWRRLAVELASRLRERSKFISQPHATPVIFIGSSTESVCEAQWLLNSLQRRPVVGRLWTQGVFQLSSTTIEDLMTTATECDFAALLLTPDDMTKSRGKTKTSPRDNAIFELGLFMGAIGRERTFIIAPNKVDLKLPTDILGMTRVTFTHDQTKTLGQCLAPVTKAIFERIKALGPR